MGTESTEWWCTIVQQGCWAAGFELGIWQEFLYPIHHPHRGLLKGRFQLPDQKFRGKGMETRKCITHKEEELYLMPLASARSVCTQEWPRGWRCPMHLFLWVSTAPTLKHPMLSVQNNELSNSWQLLFEKTQSIMPNGTCTNGSVLQICKTMERAMRYWLYSCFKITTACPYSRRLNTIQIMFVLEDDVLYPSSIDCFTQIHKRIFWTNHKSCSHLFSPTI